MKNLQSNPIQFNPRAVRHILLAFVLATCILLAPHTCHYASASMTSIFTGTDALTGLQTEPPTQAASNLDDLLKRGDERVRAGDLEDALALFEQARSIATVDPAAHLHIRLEGIAERVTAVSKERRELLDDLAVQRENVKKYRKGAMPGMALP